MVKEQPSVKSDIDSPDGAPVLNTPLDDNDNGISSIQDVENKDLVENETNVAFQNAEILKDAATEKQNQQHKHLQMRLKAKNQEREKINDIEFTEMTKGYPMKRTHH